MVMWVPLESNPDVFNGFAENVGVDINKWRFHDCYGIDPEMLLLVPQPCLSVLLLFPYTKVKNSKTGEINEITQNGQIVSEKVYYMEQLVGNACGAVGLFHALANNAETLQPKEDGFLSKFLQDTASLNPHERGEKFAINEDIQEVHEKAAVEGATEAPPAESSVDYHFVSFVCADNHIYELDGGKGMPINHGESTPETFLFDVSNVIKKSFMDHDPESPFFSIITLGPADFDF